jgi:uncharacterized protein (TIGR00725 family)
MTGGDSEALAGKPAVSQAPTIAGMRLKIGVMGGASSDISSDYLSKAARLGESIAKHGCVLVTGACPGLPLAAADAARRSGGFVIGISPAMSLEEHIDRFASPAEGHDVMIYTGAGLMGREVINIRTSDIIIVVGGRAGTLGEFAIAYEEGNLIGILQGTGGITDVIPAIIQACNKQTGAQVLYDDDPERLVALLITAYLDSRGQQSSCFAHSVDMSGARTERDVVCGMWLNPAKTPEYRLHSGQKYFFCCASCASTFDSNPASFVSESSVVQDTDRKIS